MFFFFFFNDTATTEIYTLSLHDALPIYADAYEDAARGHSERLDRARAKNLDGLDPLSADDGLQRHRRREGRGRRSEEHTSELQSRSDLVCRLLLEKKKKKKRPSASPDLR